MNNKLQSNFDDGAGGAGGGSSWSKVLKITGIGCAILVLVGALLMGLGVFKAATCCSQFEDLAAQAEEVQVKGHEFAMALHRGDFEEAYTYLSDEAQQQHTVDEFSAEFEQWRTMLSSSKPFPMRLDADIDSDDFDLSDIYNFERWVITSKFAEPRSQEVLELRFFVDTKREDDESAAFGVSSWNLELRQRRLEQDPYAQSALQFHDRIDRKNFSDARTMVSQDIAWDNPEGPGLVDDVQTLVDSLPSRATVDVYGLYPQDNTELVTVRLLLTDQEDTTYFVDYVVTWQQAIYAVSELQPAHINPEGQDEPDDDGEDTSDDDEDEVEGGGDVEADDDVEADESDPSE